MTSYAYDNAQRLSQLVQNLGGTSHDLTLTFNRNPADQITATTRSNEAYAWREHYNVSRSYTANGLNQYTASGPVVPSYDARGNLTQAGPTTYTYSSENLLTSASGGTTLSYDPLMRLHQTTSGSVTTRLAYDGQDLIAEYNGSTTLLRRYVHGPGVDEPIVWYEGAGTSDKRWLHADERGSIIAVTNSAGTAIATNTYDEYGIPGSLNLGRFQYTGQTWLAELGLYSYKARVYSPTLGRFLQTDPIGYGDGMNLYAFVGNDPINNVDPTGLCAEGPNMPTCTVTATKGKGMLGGSSGFTGKLGMTDLERSIMRELRQLEKEMGKLAERIKESRFWCSLNPIGFEGSVAGYDIFGGGAKVGAAYDPRTGLVGVSGGTEVGVGFGARAKIVTGRQLATSFLINSDGSGGLSASFGFSANGQFGPMSFSASHELVGSNMHKSVRERSQINAGVGGRGMAMNTNMYANGAYVAKLVDTGCE